MAQPKLPFGKKKQIKVKLKRPSKRPKPKAGLVAVVGHYRKAPR